MFQQGGLEGIVASSAFVKKIFLTWESETTSDLQSSSGQLSRGVIMFMLRWMITEYNELFAYEIQLRYVT